MTCQNYLKIPGCTRYDILEKKILLAMEEGCKVFLMECCVRFLKKFEIDMRFEEQISVKLLSDITNVFFLTLFLFQIIIVCSNY